MKNKLIFTSIIAVIFIIAMIVYKDSLTLVELILSFTTASGSILYVWEWFVGKELKKEKFIVEKENERLLQVNDSLRMDK